MHGQEVMMEKSLGQGGCPFSAGAVGSRENPARIDLTGGAFFHGCHALYAHLRERGATARARFYVPEPPTPPEDEGDSRPFVEEFWLITRYDEAVEILQDDTRFSIDPGIDPVDEEDNLFVRSLLTLDPPDHTRLRKLVQPWFVGAQLEALRPRIQAIANRLLDQAEA